MRSVKCRHWKRRLPRRRFAMMGKESRAVMEDNASKLLSKRSLRANCRLQRVSLPGDRQNRIELELLK